jgi:hypothetical protein
LSCGTILSPTRSKTARAIRTSDIYAYMTAPMEQQVTDTMGTMLFGKQPAVLARGH